MQLKSECRGVRTIPWTTWKGSSSTHSKIGFEPYGHAFRYWQSLGAIAERSANLEGLGAHEAYWAEIIRKHARTVSFWADVNGTRKAEPSAESDDEAENDMQGSRCGRVEAEDSVVNLEGPDGPRVARLSLPG